MKPTHDPRRGNDILRRTLDSQLSGKELRALVERALELDYNFNESFLDGENGDRFRIAGLDQTGDMVLTTHKEGRAYRTEVQFRRADREKFDALMNLLADDAKVRRKPSESEGGELLFFIRRNGPLSNKVIYAESAVESALDCEFAELDQLLTFMINLERARVHRRSGEPTGMDGEIEHYLLDRRPKRVMTTLHKGKRVELIHEVCLIGENEDLHLKVHFAWLPDEKVHLVGWFTESSELFT